VVELSLTEEEERELWELTGYAPTSGLGDYLKDPTVLLVAHIIADNDPSITGREDLPKEIREFAKLWSDFYRAKDIGDEFLGKGEQALLKKSTTLFEDVLSRAEILLTYIRAVAWAELGRLKFQVGKWQEADECTSRALSAMKVLQEKGRLTREQRALRYIEQGALYRRQGRFRLAHQEYEAAYKIYEAPNDEQGMMVADRKKAGTFLYEWKTALAMPLCKGALATTQKRRDQRSECRCLQHLAWTLALQGRLKQALNENLKALDIARQIDDRVAYRRGLRYIADIYRMSGALDVAERYYQEAYESVAEFAGRIIFDGMVFLGLGQVHMAQERWEDARTNLERSLDIHQQLGERLSVGRSLNELGRLEMKRGNYLLAENHLIGARSIFDELEVAYYQIASRVNLCALYERQGEYERMSSSANEIGEMISRPELAEEGIPWNRHLARLRVIQAQALIKQERFSEAFILYCQASEVACEAPTRFCRLTEVDYDYVLGEIGEQIITYIGDLEMSRATEQKALGLCDKLLEYWDAQDKERRDFAAEWLDELRGRRDRLLATLTIRPTRSN